MKLKALQKRIKGGGNATNFIAQDDQSNVESPNQNLELSTIEDDIDWNKADENQHSTELSVLYKLNCKKDLDLIIPNQEYEYTKILRTFLKDKKNLEKLGEGEYEVDLKNKTINRGDKNQALKFGQKLFVGDKISVNTSSLPKRLDKPTENCKDNHETNCYHDSLEFHQQLFQNNWDVLLNVYSFSKYEAESISSNNLSSSAASSLSNSDFSSVGSTRSTNFANSWSTFSFDSVKSKVSSFEEFKMYVDSIGVSANRQIIIKGSLTDNIKGGIDKSEMVC